MKPIYLTVALGLLPVPAFATCQQGLFEPFFRDFARDITVQEAVAPDLLKVSRLDPDADPEPVAVLHEIARADIEFPLVPNLVPFERAGGSVTYKTVEQGQSVTLSGDSGYLMTLVFTQDPCWRLVSIKDDSM